MSGRRRWDGRETLRGIGTEVRRGSGAPIVGYSGRLVPRLSGIQLVAASDDSITRCNRFQMLFQQLSPAGATPRGDAGKKHA